jgi:CDP-diacylglycerol--glycerol-3-phosphate 3-phosphatidyltransferase
VTIPLNIPNVLSLARITAAPMMLVAAWYGHRLLFLWIAVFCMGSDIIDGKIARWLGQTSELGAQLDSWADLAMIVCGPFCGWWLRPELVHTEALALGAVLGGYGAALAVGYGKFGRLTSYHTRAATFSAYFVGAGAIMAIAGGSTSLFRLGALLVAYAELEEVAISWVLPDWRANVPSLSHALTIRRRASVSSGPVSQ